MLLSIIRLTKVSFLKEIRASGVGLIEEDEILVVEFGEELPLGIGVLNISFQGTLNDQMKGFYRR